MKTGLTMKKKEKITEIFFDEDNPVINIRTYNTDLKNRLSAFAATYPAECRLVARDRESGLLEFEVKKGRLSFRLTAPYSAERRKRLSDNARTSPHLPVKKESKNRS